MIDEKKLKKLLRDLFNNLEGEGYGKRMLKEYREKYPELKEILKGIKPTLKGG